MTGEVDVQWVTVGELSIAYAVDGDPSWPPVLLVSGLGAQLTTWDDGFCAALVERGLYVIRFDNRDAGLSTHLDGGAYTLNELAGDTAGLIRVLGLDDVHVVGASMGGMVAQLLAIDHPDLVRSLTSIMSTTADPTVGEASPAAIALLTAPPATSRDAVIDGSVLADRVTGSPAYRRPEEEVRRNAARAYDRAYHPAGFARQLQACMSAPDRTGALRQLRVPTLVVHGAADPLIGVSGGRATAAAIPGAELLVIDGMGHDLPAAVWPQVADRIAELVRRAEPNRPA